VRIISRPTLIPRAASHARHAHECHAESLHCKIHLQEVLEIATLPVALNHTTAHNQNQYHVGMHGAAAADETMRRSLRRRQAEASAVIPRRNKDMPCFGCTTLTHPDSPLNSLARYTRLRPRRYQTRLRSWRAWLRGRTRNIAYRACNRERLLALKQLGWFSLRSADVESAWLWRRW